GGGAEVIVSGASNSKAVRIYTDTNLTGKVSDNPVGEVFNAYAANVPGGVRLAAGDTDKSGALVEVLTVPGKGVAPTLNIFDDNGDAGVKISDNPPDDSFAPFAATQKAGLFVAVGTSDSDVFTMATFPVSIPDNTPTGVTSTI